YTAMLNASLWIPYVICQVRTNGPLKPPNYIDPAQRPVPLWGRRADRAYINGVETFAPFATLVILAHLAGKADALLVFWSAAFFWIRLAYTLVYWFAVPYLRTVFFTLGWFCVCGIFWELVH